MPASERTCTRTFVWCDVIWLMAMVVTATRTTVMSEMLPLRHGCSKQQCEWQVIYCACRRVLTRGRAIKWRRVSKNTLSMQLPFLHAIPSAVVPVWRYTWAFQPSKHSTHWRCEGTVSTAAVFSPHFTYGGTIIQLDKWFKIECFQDPAAVYMGSVLFWNFEQRWLVPFLRVKKQNLIFET